MLVIDLLAEPQILAAIKRGECGNLSDKGSPLPRDDDKPRAIAPAHQPRLNELKNRLALIGRDTHPMLQERCYRDKLLQRLEQAHPRQDELPAA